MNQTQSETTLTEERLHWGVFVIPALALVFLAMAELPLFIFVHLMGNVVNQINPQSAPPFTGLMFLIFVVLDVLVVLPLLLVTWVAYLKSKLTLTNRRLIFQTGLVMRVAGELPLENVEAIIIVEPLLGRIFGYGTEIVTSVGGLRFPLRYIASPQTFHATLQKAVADAKTAGKASAKIPTPSVQDGDSRYMPRG